MHLFAQALNIVWAAFYLLASFQDGRARVIIVALVTSPILVVYFACLIRVMSEMAISLLLVPSFLAKPAGGSGRETVNGVDADLAAYGVTAVATSRADAGTIV